MLIILLLIFAASAVSLMFLRWREIRRRRQLTRTSQLDAAWRTMQAAQRINTAYWLAREAMRREAERWRS